MRNQSKFFCDDENRELDFMVIDYADLARPQSDRRNVYEVTDEFDFHNGRFGTRDDVVFLINGIPELVIECTRMPYSAGFTCLPSNKKSAGRDII
ncbi:MAG: type I restriction endonuclease [Verrucomicrobiales bacterium]